MWVLDSEMLLERSHSDPLLETDADAINFCLQWSIAVRERVTMNLNQAIAIVREITNRGRVSRDPELSRALYIVLGAAQREANQDAAIETQELISREKRLWGRAGGAGEREWTEEEDTQLLGEIQGQENVALIAKAHRRSLTSLMSRTVALGKATNLVEAFRLLTKVSMLPKRIRSRSKRLH